MQSHLPTTFFPNKRKKIDYKQNRFIKINDVAFVPLSCNSQILNFDLWYIFEPFPFIISPASGCLDHKGNEVREGQIWCQLHLTEIPGSWVVNHRVPLSSPRVNENGAFSMLPELALRCGPSLGCHVCCRILCKSWKNWKVKRSRPFI